MSAIAGASVRFLEKMAALESLVEKLTSSNQQLVIIAEHRRTGRGGQGGAAAPPIRAVCRHELGQRV